MPYRKIATLNAGAFFAFWLLILLAGADKPPPFGFFWLVVAVAICAAVVYWRVPSYIDWYCTRRAGRYALVLLDGAVAGLLVALPFALQGSGEPSVTVRPVDYAIWFAVLVVIGMLNSVVLYLINALVASKIGLSKEAQ